MAENHSPNRLSRQSGMSLIEVLIASLIIFFIFLSILPLFARAKESNRRGADASKMSGFLQSEIEAANQLVISHGTFNSTLNTQDELDKIAEDNADESGNDSLMDKALPLDHDFYYGSDNYAGTPTQFFGMGTRDDVILADEFLGDEEWLARDELDSHEGNVLWFKDVAYFGYGYSDVHSGTISVPSGGGAAAITVVGEPRLFDNPLAYDPESPPDIKEQRVFIRSATAASPLGVGSVLALGYYRSF